MRRNSRAIVLLLTAAELIAISSCSKSRTTSNQQWRITVLSARIAADRVSALSAFSSQPSSSLREERFEATIIEVETERLDSNAVAVDFMKTQLTSTNGLTTHSPYQVVTLTNSETGEKSYELYFPAMGSEFTLSFPGFPPLAMKAERARKR